MALLLGHPHDRDGDFLALRGDLGTAAELGEGDDPFVLAADVEHHLILSDLYDRALDDLARADSTERLLQDRLIEVPSADSVVLFVRHVANLRDDVFVALRYGASTPSSIKVWVTVHHLTRLSLRMTSTSQRASMPCD
jgi:hypothetical protein